MKKFNYLPLGLILFFIILLFGCCTNNTNMDNDNFYYVEHKGANFPVWVKGNIDSQTFVVFLHGGPGETAFIYPYITVIEEMENDYAFVFWDQRNAGQSFGNPDPSTLNMAQFVEDTDVIIQSIIDLYDVSSIFLIGHSWGGQLGQKYLLSSYKDDLIKGWIDMDGANGFDHIYTHGRQWALTEIPNLLTEDSLASDKRTTLEEALVWYQNNPHVYRAEDSSSVFFERFIQHGQYIKAAGGYEYNVGAMDNIISSMPIFDPSEPVDLFHYLGSGSGLFSNWPTSDIVNIIDADDLSLMTTPTLLISGKYDGIVPLSIAQEKFAALSSLGSNDKSLVIFDKSGHTPMVEEGDKWKITVQSFIETYR
jgi:pimeloyl-ACP methyl ester carboxylesterase